MKIAVLGAGAWGTALAIHAAQRHDVMLWSRNAQVLESLRTTGTNQRYLPDVKVPSFMGFTDRLGEAAQAVAQAYAEHGFAEPRFLPMVAGFAADHDWPEHSSALGREGDTLKGCSCGD